MSALLSNTDNATDSLAIHAAEIAWCRLSNYLRQDGDVIVDSVACGEAIAWEIEDLLTDYGISWCRESRKRFAALCESIISEG